MGMTARIAFKKGVVLHPRHLDFRMIEGLLVARACAPERQGGVMVVSSADNGEHTAHSLHHHGRAWDIRYKGHFDPGDREGAILASSENEMEHLARGWFRALHAQLPAEWDVVLEATHIHLELDVRK